MSGTSIIAQISISLKNIPLIIKHIEEKVKYFALSDSLLGLPLLLKRPVMHVKINQYFERTKVNILLPISLIDTVLLSI